MCSTCIPIFVGGASPVSEIFLFLKLTNFPFTIVHGSEKIESLRIG